MVSIEYLPFFKFIPSPILMIEFSGKHVILDKNERRGIK